MEQLQNLARRFGVDVRRYRAVGARRNALLQRHRIKSTIDAGANKGQYAAQLRACGFQGTIVSFEPLSAPYAVLAAQAADDPLWRTHQSALGNVVGGAQINVAANTASSSMLSMLPAHEELAPYAMNVATEEVVLTRLDEVDGVAELEAPLLLKLDVQGYELAVIDGAERTLQRTALLEAEVSVRALYEGQPLLGDVLDVVRAKGFELVALEPGFYDPKDGAIVQYDAFFTGPQ